MAVRRYENGWIKYSVKNQLISLYRLDSLIDAQAKWLVFLKTGKQKKLKISVSFIFKAISVISAG